MKRPLALLLLLCIPVYSLAAALIPPLEVDIFDAARKKRGQALLYPNFVELLDLEGNMKGAIGVVNQQGRLNLFLVRADQERRFIGWARDSRLHDAEDKLVGFYYWSPIRSYVYDPEMKKVGEAQCLAYQGVCAAGIAGFLLGLL